MAFMVCTAPCICCNTLFNFNPDKVPSLRYQGNREPVCRECVEAANLVRAQTGLKPFPILPGAYDPQEVD